MDGYKQIVPADGWVAVFSRNKPDEQGRHFFIDPLAVRNRAAFVERRTLALRELPLLCATG